MCVCVREREERERERERECVCGEIFQEQTHNALAMHAESTIAIKTEKVEHALATHKTIDFRCERPRVTTGALITWPAANR